MNPRRLLILLTCLAAVLGIAQFADTSTLAEDPQPAKENADVPAVLNFTVQSIAGKDVKLSKYHGDVVLIVNTASKCGRTPQYKQLQELHEKYADKGLSILGFPANNFRQQEPGTNEQILEFCEENYGVKFDLFAKVSVKGEDICPLYKFLTSKETNPKFGGEIEWNFDKFLVSRSGEVVARFKSKTRPDEDAVIEAIEAQLAKPNPKGEKDQQPEKADKE